MLSEQAEQLKRFGGPSNLQVDDFDAEPSRTIPLNLSQAAPMTEDDLRREQELVKELENRKRTLEERVEGMQKDLGGILR